MTFSCMKFRKKFRIFSMSAESVDGPKESNENLRSPRVTSSSESKSSDNSKTALFLSPNTKKSSIFAQNLDGIEIVPRKSGKNCKNEKNKLKPEMNRTKSDMLCLKPSPPPFASIPSLTSIPNSSSHTGSGSVLTRSNLISSSNAASSTQPSKSSFSTSSKSERGNNKPQLISRLISSRIAKSDLFKQDRGKLIANKHKTKSETDFLMMQGKQYKTQLYDRIELNDKEHLYSPLDFDEDGRFRKGQKPISCRSLENQRVK